MGLRMIMEEKYKYFISYITSAYHFFDWTRKSKILPDTFKNFLNGHSV